MKNIKILLLLTFAIFSSCDLEENPPFLDESVYSDPEIVVSALDGIYAALTTYNAQERRLFVINGYSGFFNTRKQGGNINNPNNANLFSLKPRQNEADVAAMWAGLYTTIARCNAAIANIPYTDPSIATADELILNDAYGQALFIRSWSYFSLVRMFGDIPLWTQLFWSLYYSWIIGIVCYDQLFHNLALERNLTPKNLPISKQAVRDHLREIGSEDIWIEMQMDSKRILLTLRQSLYLFLEEPASGPLAFYWAVLIRAATVLIVCCFALESVETVIAQTG